MGRSRKSKIPARKTGRELCIQIVLLVRLDLLDEIQILAVSILAVADLVSIIPPNIPIIIRQ